MASGIRASHAIVLCSSNNFVALASNIGMLLLVVLALTITFPLSQTVLWLRTARVDASLVVVGKGTPVAIMV